MKKHQNLIFMILAAVIMIGVGITFYMYWQGENSYTTDNAKVTADLRTVSPKVAGEIVSWNVKEGTTVKANQVLGRLNNGEDLKSPISGVVVKSGVVVNQQVSPSTVAAVIADTSDVYVLANIEETDISKIKVGQPVNAKLDAYGGKGVRAHVAEIDAVTVAALSGNATSFSTSGTYTKVIQLIPVKISIDEKIELSQYIGTNATVRIDCRSKEPKQVANEGTKQANEASNSDVVPATGVVKVNREKNITLDFSATVQDVLVTNGQRVSAGDVLMNLDLQDIHKQIANQENNLRMEQLQLEKLKNNNANSSSLESTSIQGAEDRLKQAKEDLEKQSALYQAGAISKQALTDAQNKVRDTERALKDAHISKTSDYKLSMDIQMQKIASIQSDLTQLKNKLNKPYIKGNSIVSEFKNGLVSDISLVAGDIFMTNTKVLKLIDLDSMIVEAKIPEHLIKAVKLNATVQMTPLFDSGKTYTGKVTKISNIGIVEGGETLIVVEIAIDTPDVSIRPNFNVDVQIKRTMN